MNETLKTIAERYSCRDFSSAPLSDSQIKALVEAALAAPSARNLQPWHVTVVTDKKLIEELDAEGMNLLATAEDKSSYDFIMERGGKMLFNAPCMIVVASDGSKWAPTDCGILSQNVALAAHSLGLGNVLCGMARVLFSGPRGDELKKKLKFPDGYSFGLSILVGKANSGKEPHEFDMSKVSYI